MRRSVRGFLSYAHDDHHLVDRLRHLLGPRLAIDRGAAFSVWWDAAILIGEHWERRIRQEMAAADFCLLLLSPAFLSRPFVTGVEIPAILADPHVLALPVGLQWVDFARSDLRGLDARQVFRFPCRGRSEPRFFADLAGQNPARFCDALAAEISARCLGHLTPA